MSTARRAALALSIALGLSGCLLRPSPPLQPIDCASVDRAAERYPDVCDGGAEPEEDDAGTEDGASGGSAEDGGG